MPLQYLAALITPAGRIPQFPFAMLCVVLALGNLWVYKEARKVGAPSELYMTVLLFLIWSKFCIMSRRMHDTGKGGVILVPILMAAIAAFLLSYDQQAVGGIGHYKDKLALYAETGVKAVRSLFIAVFIYLIRAPGDDGPNAYGPEWDDIPDDDRPVSQSLKGKTPAPVAEKTAFSSPVFSSTSRASRKAIARLHTLGDQGYTPSSEPQPAGIVASPARTVKSGPAREGFGKRG